MKCRYSKVASREDRSEFIVKSYKHIFDKAESILDVGSSSGALKSILGNKVTDLDADEVDVSDNVSGSPDYTVNLEKELLSGFRDEEFDVVVCSDVLEHLDNFHGVLDDIVRVARKHIIITLPNCTNTWRALRILFKQTAGRQYGLPLDRRQDRHKWFFSWREADSFMKNYCENMQVKVQEKFLLFNNDTNSMRCMIISRILRLRPLSSFSETYYVLLTKQHHE